MEENIVVGIDQEDRVGHCHESRFPLFLCPGYLLVQTGILDADRQLIGKMLDEKSAAIAKELDDARKLREDAAALLSSYQRKQRDAEREADDILAGARAEAERIQAEARTQTAQVIERRTKLAEQKIAQAELSALAEVKAAAADAAIAAARTIIEKRMGEDEARAYANGGPAVIHVPIEPNANATDKPQYSEFKTWYAEGTQ